MQTNIEMHSSSARGQNPVYDLFLLYCYSFFHLFFCRANFLLTVGMYRNVLMNPSLVVRKSLLTSDEKIIFLRYGVYTYVWLQMN
jgi:hypothetical protein